MPTPVQKPSGQLMGYLPVNPQAGTATLQLTSGVWLAMSFVLDAAKTLSAVEQRFSAVAGSLGANDLTCDIYSSVNGLPGVSLANSNVLQTPAAAGVTAVFTGFSVALSASTQYWVVYKNVNATPNTNNATYRFGATGTGITAAPTASVSLQRGWNKVHSVNSGSTWTTRLPDVFGLRLDFSDGTYAGEPVLSANNSASGVGVFSSNELGALFTTPPNTAWWVRGITLCVGKVGSPTGNLRFRIYQGTTLLATTQLIPPGDIATGANNVAAYFTTDQLILGGQALRVVAGVDSGGDSSNYYFVIENTIANDANSRQLFPFASAANPSNGPVKTFFNGTSWADTNTTVIPFALILDTEGEFAPPWPRGIGMTGGCGG